MQEMDDDHATRLKHDLQIVLGSSTWTMLYSAIIISQTVLLAWDRWDTPLWTQNFLHLYYGFAQVWFLIELVMLWLVREPSHALHFSQVVPLQHAAEGLPDQAGKVPVDKRESKLGSEDDGDSGEGKAETSAVRSSEDAVDVDRAVVLIKVILLASGLVGVLTKQRAWTHIQALRIIWPATKLLPVLTSLLRSSFRALLAITNFLCFVIVLMLCWAVVGRYVFGVKLAQASRSHFGDLGTGVVMTCVCRLL